MFKGKSVFIPCKPYVKQFLIQNFGEPVNFYPSANPYLTFFRSCLSDPTPRYQQRMPCTNCNMLAQREKPIHIPKARIYQREHEKMREVNKSRTDIVEFIVSEADFYDVGWCIKPLQVAALNACFEQNIKGFMRTSIMVDVSVTGNLAESIHRFQNNYNFPEEIWSYEAIKKDLYRHTQKNKISFEKEIYTKIQEIVTVQLSDLGTISKSNQLPNANSRKRKKQPRGHRKIVVNPVQLTLYPGKEHHSGNVQASDRMP